MASRRCKECRDCEMALQKARLSNDTLRREIRLARQVLNIGQDAWHEMVMNAMEAEDVSGE